MIDHNAQGWRLNTWKEVKEVIVEAMQKGNMFISEADAMFTGTNQFLHMRLFYFVYIPNESRVMIIYSAPFDFFDDTIMEHEFERE